MERIKRALFCLCLLFPLLFVGCSGTKKVTNVLTYRTPYNGEVLVKGLGEIVPEGAVLLGSVSVGEGGFTRTKNCTYQAVIADIRSLAAGMGGNAVVITKHKEPSVWESSCHQISANVYFIPVNQ
ncbi:MAG: DUF4156 domain-containing protein [Bacteroidales bacterium]|nr:DUF4156 domain-containing protein [Bacteroidales bacterium]